jgi:uncharacterized protein (TIGR00369 family)
VQDKETIRKVGYKGYMKTVSDILELLETLSNEEIDQVSHVINALKGSKEGLHYNGRLQGINLEDHGEMTMTLGLHNANTYGVAQGGALYTLADVAIGFTIMTKIPDDCQVFTLELKMNYVKPGKGEKLYARPIINHLGKNTVVAECKVVDEQNELVALALGTFFIKRGKK